jgi:hypothetical protein
MSFGPGILRGSVQEGDVRRAILGPEVEKLGDGVGSCNPAAQVHPDLRGRRRVPPLDGNRHFFWREQLDHAVG